MSASKQVPHRFGTAQGFLPNGAFSCETAGKAMNLMKHVFDIGHLYRALEVRLRFGHLSRAPLRLLRLELRGNAVECDWLARPADPWDADLPRPVGDRHASLQALEDAIAVRDLVFGVLRGADNASLRVYRESPDSDLELIIAGTVTREQSAERSIRSLAMRAKLLGLQFWLEDGILEALQPEECPMSF